MGERMDDQHVTAGEPEPDTGEVMPTGTSGDLDDAAERPSSEPHVAAEDSPEEGPTSAERERDDAEEAGPFEEPAPASGPATDLDEIEAAPFEDDYPTTDETDVVADGPEPQPVAPLDGRALPALEEAVEGLDERLGTLGDRVDELARLGTRTADMNDALYAENQRLRGGELAQAVAPLVRDLVRLHDQVVLLDGQAAPASGAAGGQSALGDVRVQLLEILSRNGVERFDVASGAPFDAARHQGVASSPTVNQGADRTVVRQIRCGFTHPDGRLLRPADVEVYRYRAQD